MLLQECISWMNVSRAMRRVSSPAVSLRLTVERALPVTQKNRTVHYVRACVCGPLKYFAVWPEIIFTAHDFTPTLGK